MDDSSATKQHSAFVTKLIDLTDDPIVARKVHGWLALFWLMMAVPSALTGLKSSISYLVAVSVYAIVVSHWSGYQAAGAEVKVEQAADEAREASEGAEGAESAAMGAEDAALGIRTTCQTCGCQSCSDDQ